MPRRLVPVRLLAASAAAFALALAAPAGPPEGTASDAAARLPRSAEWVLIIDNSAAVRLSPQWRAIGPALSRFAPVARAEKDPGEAWSALAKALGWSEDETFDRLLGTRVVLVMGHSAAPDSPAPWALLSDTSSDTDRRLRERLHAAPRGVVKDHQVLAIESGNYELTTHRAPGAAGGRATLILGPAGRSELFDEMIGVVADRAAEPLRGTPAFGALGRLGRAEVLFLIRVDASGPEKAAAGPWNDFIAVACRQSAGGWDADILIRDTSHAEGLRSVRETSDSAFRALAPASLAAIVETRLAAGGGGAEEETNPISRILTRIGVPQPMQAVLGVRQAFVVRAASSPPGVAVALAVDTTDAAAMTRFADQFVAATVGSIEESTSAGGPRPLVPDFHALAPEAVRVLPMEVPGEAMPPILGPARPVVAWATSAMAEPASAERRGAPGWWTVALAPSASDDDPGAPELVRAVAGALRGVSPEAVTRQWVSLGEVKPARLEASISATVPDVGSWRDLCRRIGGVSWELWSTPEGDIAGRIAIRIESATR